MTDTWTLGEFEATVRPERMDLDRIEALLRTSYWAADRSRERIEGSVANAICIGLFHGDRQIGFARVVTDRFTFAWLCDVIVEESYRGRGLAQFMLNCLFDYEGLREVTRWVLATTDMHRLYEKYGFANMANPDRWMLKLRNADPCMANVTGASLPNTVADESETSGIAFK